MPDVRFAIAEYPLLNLGPPPPSLDEWLEIIQRPGVDGLTILELGIAGRPFQMRSEVDCLNESDAFATFVGYTSLRLREDPVPLLWRGIDFSAASYFLVVLNVRATFIGTVGLVSGGFFEGGSGWLEAEWELLPVKFEG